MFLRTKTDEDGDRHIEVLHDPMGNQMLGAFIVDRNDWLYVGVPKEDDVTKVTPRMLDFLDGTAEEGTQIEKFNALWDQVLADGNMMKVVL